MALQDPRNTFKPFKYPKAFDFWLMQQQAHWLATEVSLNSDLMDWKQNLTEAEKSVIGGILKGFTQAEIVVGDYWTNKVTKWFPHPEIVMAATTMGAFETVHIHGYSLLDESLGFQDYEAYVNEPTIKAKLDHLISVPGDTKEEIARSLAIFSAFMEGVSLFSSFAVLMSFSRYNKLKGVAQIVSWSVRDESLHSQFGCWLFKQFISENPDIWTDEFKKTIYQAARDIIELEDNFIDMVFSNGPIEGLDPLDLKQFIRNRANVKLGDLGLKQNWKNIDKDALKRMEWFDYLSAGVRHDDFFAAKVSDYSKSLTFDDDMF